MQGFLAQKKLNSNQIFSFLRNNLEGTGKNTFKILPYEVFRVFVEVHSWCFQCAGSSGSNTVIL